MEKFIIYLNLYLGFLPPNAARQYVQPSLQESVLARADIQRISQNPNFFKNAQAWSQLEFQELKKAIQEHNFKEARERFTQWKDPFHWPDSIFLDERAPLDHTQDHWRQQKSHLQSLWDKEHQKHLHSIFKMLKKSSKNENKISFRIRSKLLRLIHSPTSRSNTIFDDIQGTSSSSITQHQTELLIAKAELSLQNLKLTFTSWEDIDIALDDIFKNWYRHTSKLDHINTKIIQTSSLKMIQELEEHIIFKKNKKNQILKKYPKGSLERLLATQYIQKASDTSLLHTTDEKIFATIEPLAQYLWEEFKTIQKSHDEDIIERVQKIEAFIENPFYAKLPATFQTIEWAPHKKWDIAQKKIHTHLQKVQSQKTPAARKKRQKAAQKALKKWIHSSWSSTFERDHAYDYLREHHLNIESIREDETTIRSDINKRLDITDTTLQQAAYVMQKIQDGRHRWMIDLHEIENHLIEKSPYQNDNIPHQSQISRHKLHDIEQRIHSTLLHPKTIHSIDFEQVYQKEEESDPQRIKTKFSRPQFIQSFLHKKNFHKKKQAILKELKQLEAELHDDDLEDIDELLATMSQEEIIHEIYQQSFKTSYQESHAKRKREHVKAIRQESIYQQRTESAILQNFHQLKSYL